MHSILANQKFSVFFWPMFSENMSSVGVFCEGVTCCLAASNSVDFILFLLMKF